MYRVFVQKLEQISSLARSCPRSKLVQSTMAQVSLDSYLQFFFDVSLIFVAIRFPCQSLQFSTMYTHDPLVDLPPNTLFIFSFHLSFHLSLSLSLSLESFIFPRYFISQDVYDTCGFAKYRQISQYPWLAT